MARNRYLDRRSFRAFLEEHGDRPVGWTKDIHECPVALFLEKATNREWHASPLACVPQVDAAPGEDPFELDHEFRTPRWARDFIHALDRHFGRKPRMVTGNDALYVLNEAVA